MAADIKWLKFVRKNSDEYWYRVDCKLLDTFVNVRSIYVLFIDGFYTWNGSIIKGNHPWSCADEDVVFTRFGDERVLRGMEIEEYFRRIVDFPLEE